MQTMVSVPGVVVAAVVIYFGVRVVATVVDVIQRWRTGNWEV